jgi:hypothetical protein
MTPPQKCCVAKWKAALLGGFVCWQLFYLPAANGLKFVPIRVPFDPGDVPFNLQRVGRFTADNRIQHVADCTYTGLSMYGEFSGQIQSWKLFTPELPSQTVVLVTIVEWKDGRKEEITSPLAPPTPTPDFRLPRLDVRPFHFEASIGLGPWSVPSQDDAPSPEVVRDLIIDWARMRTYSVRIAMLRHWETIRTANAGVPSPVSMTLVTRFIPTPHIGEERTSDGQFIDRPFVRWSNPFGPDDRIEVYDPNKHLFVAVPDGPP